MFREWTHYSAARSEIASCARAWLGTRFRHQGRSAEGIDCAGLVIRVGNALGLIDFDTHDYARSPDGVRMRRACDAQLVRIEPAHLQPGDVGLFRIEADPQHLAIFGDYFGGGVSMIHAYAPAHKVVETRFDAAWRAKLVAAYAFPGVA